MGKIHSPYTKFKGWLRSMGLTYKDIGKDIGNSVATVSAKVNGQSDFLLSETQMLIKKYNIEEDVFR